MVIFLKFMTVSACLLLALLILYAGRETFKETKADKVVWFVLYLYTLGLIFTALKVLFGG